jgi:cell division protein FtsL
MGLISPTKEDLSQACETAGRAVSDLQAAASALLGPYLSDGKGPPPKLTDEDWLTLSLRLSETKVGVIRPFEDVARRQRVAENASLESIRATIERRNSNYSQLCYRLSAQEMESRIAEIFRAFGELEMKLKEVLDQNRLIP